jgi:drug/metabolite transporter (DMT)-like permease
MNTPPQLNKQQERALLPILAGITTAFLWGISFLFTKDALNYTFPAQVLGLRFGAGALSMTLLVIFRLIKIDFKGKSLGSLILLSFFQPFLYFIGETWGVKWTSASEAGMVIGLVPVATALMASIFLHERMRLFQSISVVFSVAGVFVIVGARGPLSIGLHVWGILALFLAVISTSVYSILSKKSSQRFTSVEITFVMMWLGAILFNLMGVGQSIGQGTLLSYLSPLKHTGVSVAVLYLGVLSSVGGFFLFNYALSHLKVSQSAPLINLTTVVSVIGGVVLQGDPFGWIELAGVALIITGVWGTNAFSDS